MGGRWKSAWAPNPFRAPIAATVENPIDHEAAHAR